MKPISPLCPACEESYLGFKPGMEDQRINWLFLYLKGVLGVLSKKQLQYFCDTTMSSTKDLLLYSVFVDIEEQLGFVPPATVVVEDDPVDRA
ncbi:hypothetical protein Vadar_022223 [Vaccinium darrowii]|uniref:Uncharacterized protein n=1 Tax=Vaccinium darrowii TaxID=229202 RepID=A0ACB7Z702_9ERIC|nr:hypothetical protein Vadar_022223 [Vaccinium darrowii]